MKKIILTLAALLTLPCLSFASASVSKTFSGTGRSGAMRLAKGKSLTYSVTGVFVSTVSLDISCDGLNWTPTGLTISGSASGTRYSDIDGVCANGAVLYSWSCTAYTSGSPAVTLVDSDDVIKQFVSRDGDVVMQINDRSVVVVGTFSATNLGGTVAQSDVTGLLAKFSSVGDSTSSLRSDLANFNTVLTTFTIKGNSLSLGATSFVVVPSGNVGISTANPVWPLTLVTNSSTGLTEYQAASGNSVTGMLWSQGGSGSAFVVRASTELVGNSAAGQSQIILENTSNAPSNFFFFRTSSGTWGAPSLVASANRALGTILWQGWTSQGVYSNLARITVQSEGVPGSASNYPTHMDFYTSSTGTISGTEKMRITSAGNVGIGTTVPGSVLTVAGSGNVPAASFSPNLSSFTVSAALSGTFSASSDTQCIAGSTITLTIPPNGGSIHVNFNGSAATNTLAETVWAGILVDGAYVNGETATKGLSSFTEQVANDYNNLSFSVIVTGLSVSQHNICLFMSVGTPGVGLGTIDSTNSVAKLSAYTLP